MADVLVGSERRVLISGYGLPAPPPESLLGRLDQIDLRLRQLEEQRRPAHAQHQHTKSLPSALQHVQLRGTLMDRLNLLESRIRQLSCELDLDGGGKATAGSYVALGTSSSVAPQDPAWSGSVPLMEPFRNQAAMCAPDKSAADGSWSAVQMLQRGAHQLHRNKSNPPKVKSLKDAKCACEKEKRKAERSRTSRRWFTVGC